MGASWKEAKVWGIVADGGDSGSVVGGFTGRRSKEGVSVHVPLY